jgi:hypothetical protein
MIVSGVLKRRGLGKQSEWEGGPWVIMEIGELRLL